jgi:hypothetical protein
MSERDKFLTEQMGECWHDLFRHCSKCAAYCRKCQKEIYEEQNNFSTWEGFGKLWEWAQKQEWWREFHNQFLSTPWKVSKLMNTDLVHPDRFADAVYEYLRQREQG